MGYVEIEDTRIYQQAEALADAIRDEVMAWSEFARETVGKQLVKAVDSIGANLAESAGRYHPGDVLNFLFYSRGSLRETKYWLRRARRRGLLSPAQYKEFARQVDNLAPQLNAFISYQRRRKSQAVKESPAEYRVTADIPDDAPSWLDELQPNLLAIQPSG